MNRDGSPAGIEHIYIYIYIYIYINTWSKTQQDFRISKNIAFNFFKTLKRINNILKDRRNSW